MPLYRIVGFGAASLCGAQRSSTVAAKAACSYHNRLAGFTAELECNDEGGSAHVEPTSTVNSLSLSVFPRWMGTDWGCATASPETLTVKDKGRDRCMGARRNKRRGKDGMK